MNTIEKMQADIAALRIMAVIALAHSASSTGDMKGALAVQKKKSLEAVENFTIEGSDDSDAVKDRMRQQINDAFNGLSLS